MKSLRHVVTLLVTLALAAVLSGCSKDSAPTGLSQLDQAPPAIPSQIIADLDASAGTAALEWIPSSSANAAGYEIYQYLPYPQSVSSYALVGEVGAAVTEYNLPWSNSPTTLYYRICTVSTTGVKSALSAPVRVTVGPTLPGGGDEPPAGEGEWHPTKP